VSGSGGSAGLVVQRRTPDGGSNGSVELDAAYFGEELNLALLHQVVTAQQAAARSGTHNTRTRSEARGGGAKPYRQKGTGRARQGSERSPQFVGGGVALGPKPRSYRQRTPRRMVRQALRSALSDRARSGRVMVVDEWDFEVPSTREALEALKSLGVEGRVLVVLEPDDWTAGRSFANLSRVDVTSSSELSAYDVIRSDWVVFTQSTVPGDSVATDGPVVPPETAPETPEEAGPELPAAEAAEPAEEDEEAAEAEGEPAEELAGDELAGDEPAEQELAEDEASEEEEERL
jgi:large subunit ribosomal protein L4